jgi:hypothetical protein
MEYYCNQAEQFWIIIPKQYDRLRDSTARYHLRVLRYIKIKDN